MLIEQFGAVKTRRIVVEGDEVAIIGCELLMKSPGANQIVKHRRLRNSFTGLKISRARDLRTA